MPELILYFYGASYKLKTTTIRSTHFVYIFTLIEPRPSCIDFIPFVKQVQYMLKILSINLEIEYKSTSFCHSDFSSHSDYTLTIGY